MQLFMLDKVTETDNSMFHSVSRRVFRMMTSCGVAATVSILLFTFPAKAGVQNYTLTYGSTDIARLRLSCSTGLFRKRVLSNIRFLLGALPGETAYGGETEINALTPDGFQVRSLFLVPTGVFSLRGRVGVPNSSENVSIRGEYYTQKKINPDVTEIYRYTLARNKTIPLAPPAPCPTDNKDDDGGGGGGGGGGGEPCSGCSSFNPYSTNTDL
jgi:hypothetical protein